MPKSRKEKNNELAGFWRLHMVQWARSGLTQTEYCRHNEISRDRFTYWKRKFKEQNLPVKFVQLPMPVHTHSKGLKLNLGQGVQIEIPDGFARDTLERVLAALRAIP